MAGSSAALDAQDVLRYPPVNSNRIRMEKHLLPAVSTGPLHPTWSPDGQWIAFSMRGDIWKVPVGGGQAIALTSGPAYHFEPEWSPDGQWIALSRDMEGNLDVGVVSADGGEVRRVTEHPHIDIQPVWTPDGRGLYFASARDGNLDLYFVDIEGGTPTRVVGGAGHQIQPALSPDGTTLVFVGPVRGRVGTGGLWALNVDSGGTAAPGAEPHLIHFEETSFRTAPRWTPDGSALVFVTDGAGSNDIATVPVDGGAPARLTEDPGRHELTPVVSPDGSRIAFVSNRGGPTSLFHIPSGGSRPEGWTSVPITSRRPSTPTGTLTVQVRGPDGAPLPARLYVRGSDGRGYAPDGGFHRVIGTTETHYFHAAGAVDVEVPAGAATVDAIHGFEFEPASVTVDVPAGGSAVATLRLRRMIDAPAMGWYSGETHAHDLHQGRYGLTHEDFFGQLRAEDLHMTNALIHMDGTRVMGRWEDLTGSPHPLSTSEHILQYGQEFRGSFGHVGLLGIHEFVMPLIGGATGTAFAEDVFNFEYLAAAVAQGGIGGFMHPYTQPVDVPADGSNSEIALDVALGHGVFFDVLSIWYDELQNAEMYYRYLNAGFRLAATGGSDNFSDVWRDPPPGTVRTYARLDGPLSVVGWLDAVRAGKTFGTSGPLLFATVEGRAPGEEIRLSAVDPSSLEVAVEVVSMSPLDRIEVVVNGHVVETVPVADRGSRFRLSVPVELDGSGWIAVRALGPASPLVSDAYAFAHTSPVYVVRDGRTYRSADDAEFLARMVEAMWERVEGRDRWTTPAAKARYLQAVEEAVRVYRSIAREAGAG